jgi:protein TonB
VLFAALPLLRQLPIAISVEPFRWDVTLVQSSEIGAETTPPAETLERVMPTSMDPAPLSPKVDNPLDTAAHANNFVPVPATPETTAVAAIQSNDPLPPLVPTETTSALQETTVKAEPQPLAPAPTQSIPVSTEQSLTALRTSDPPVQPTEPPGASTLQDQPAPTAVATGSNNSSAPSTEAVQAISQTASSPAQTDTASAARADYGWLQRAIFQRLEEIKRSSRPSLDQSRPLKVLVKAVVSDEGMLVEAEVVKSSGLDHIDQEAMALVQRAFPLQLDRPLDRRQIVMRIPITYSRY